MASSDPAVDALASLLRQTPPGQVAKVYHDLRVLLDASGGSGASDQLRAAAWPVLSAYNTGQLITVKTPAPVDAPDAAPAQPLIISAAGIVRDEAADDGAVRFADPRAQTSYAFDPLRLRLFDPQPLMVNVAYDQLRCALDTAAAKYTSHHYQDGVTSTFVQVAPEPEGETLAQACTESAEAASPLDETAATGAGIAVEEDLTPREAAQEESGEHEAGERETEANAEEPSATDTAEGAAEERLESGQSPQQREEATEDALLSDELEKTRLDAETAEQEPKAEQLEQGEPEMQAETVPETAASASPQVPSGAPTFTLYIVGNRYNLANYWAGRWRSTYVLSLPRAADAAASGLGGGLKVQGKVQVQVHYFEDGNVQLSAEHAPELPIATEVDVAAVLDGSAAPEAYTTLAEDIVRCIKVDEQAYHAALEATLTELSERTFRALRRQLPVTKQKLDWNRAVSYNLASDLAR